MNVANKIIYVIFPSSQSIVIKFIICHIDLNGGFPGYINTNKELQVLSEKLRVDELHFTYFIENRRQTFHSDMTNI